MGCCLDSREQQDAKTEQEEEIKQQKDDEIELKNDNNKEWIMDIPLNELAKVHQELRDKYKNVKSDEIKEGTYNKALMAFNGYYQMNTAEGAFLTIDTNLYVSGAVRIYTIDIIISLDGQTSQSYPFNGTFNDNKLILEGLFLSLDLDFEHKSFSGTIAAGGHGVTYSVTGSTYNNPIPCHVYIGEYYQIKDDKQIKVMQISDDYQLEYDYDSNDGILKSVPTYVYNLNMYFFSFERKISETETNEYRLIMGTAAASGFACNNVSQYKINNKTIKVVARSLCSIPFPNIINKVATLFTEPNANSELLAEFSGYYAITATTDASGISVGAFISIQAEYTVKENKPNYKVLIGVSMDGKTSNGYTFDDTMSFTNNTLEIPDVLTIHLVRNTTIDLGEIARITSGIVTNYSEQKIPISGFTYFNPVPLSGFGGKYYYWTKIDGKLSKINMLDVINDYEIEINGGKLDSFIYVPIMYILATKQYSEWLLRDVLYVDLAAVEMSFGTDGKKGNTCIITVYFKPDVFSKYTSSKMFVVHAIPATPI
eukprot:126105_1